MRKSSWRWSEYASCTYYASAAAHSQIFSGKGFGRLRHRLRFRLRRTVTVIEHCTFIVTPTLNRGWWWWWRWCCCWWCEFESILFLLPLPVPPNVFVLLLLLLLLLHRQHRLPQIPRTSSPAASSSSIHAEGDAHHNKYDVNALPQIQSRSSWHIQSASIPMEALVSYTTNSHPALALSLFAQRPPSLYISKQKALS